MFPSRRRTYEDAVDPQLWCGCRAVVGSEGNMGMRAHLTERVRLEVGDTVVDEAALRPPRPPCVGLPARRARPAGSARRARRASLARRAASEVGEGPGRCPVEAARGLDE